MDSVPFFSVGDQGSNSITIVIRKLPPLILTEEVSESTVLACDHGMHYETEFNFSPVS